MEQQNKVESLLRLLCRHFGKPSLLRHALFPIKSIRLEINEGLVNYMVLELQMIPPDKKHPAIKWGSRECKYTDGVLVSQKICIRENLKK